MSFSPFRTMQVERTAKSWLTKPSDGFSLSFTSSFAGVSGSAFLHEKSNSVSDEDTLFHGETLFVFTTGDSKDVAFEFIAQWIGGDFVGDSLFVHVLDFVFIIDFKGFLLAGGRVSDVDFHNDKFTS